MQPFMNFLNIALKNILLRKRYAELGKAKKYFNIEKFANVQNMVKIFSGYQANFIQKGKNMYLRVNPAHKIVRMEKVLTVINNVYSSNSKEEREFKREKVKEALIGKTVVTNYGKTRYLYVTDVVFEKVDDVKISGTEDSLRKYYL